MVDIVIVQYGQPELEAECVASVTAAAPDVDFTVYMYDNFVTDFPLAKVWNEAISKSEAEFICLLNNDTRITQIDWLSKLLEVFRKNPGAGIVGPVTNHAAGSQGRKKPGLAKRVYATNMLSGFCMMFRRSLWEEVGGFDEEYELYGEDSDFCRAVMEKGYTLFVRDDVFIFHHGAQGTPVATKKGKDIAAIRKRSSARYTRKWGNKRI